jgi:hypothetical protein
VIAHYPEFTKVDLAIKDNYEKIIRKFPSYSDFNFVSLFCWNTDGSAEVSRLGDGIVIKLKDYTSEKTVYSYMTDSSDAIKYINELFNVTDTLSLVPETTIKSLSNIDDFIIEEDLDNFDYIYKVDELLKMGGGALKKKRNKVNQFKNDLSEVVTTKTYKKVTDIQRLEAEGLFAQWCFENDKFAIDLLDESSAIFNAIDNLEQLDLVFIELRVKDKLKGFSINQKVDSNTAVCHFEKTVRAHVNIGPYLVNKVAEELDKMGCEYVNWEQDLGIVGLRQAKKSYQNSHHLKKYILKKAS